MDAPSLLSVFQILFQMTRLAKMLPSFGPAKLVRHSWISDPKAVLSIMRDP